MLPTFGSLINQLPAPVKSLTRKLEKAEKKLVNCFYGVKFLKTCLKEGLLPKFTDIRSYDPATKEEQFTANYRKEVLQHELKN